MNEEGTLSFQYCLVRMLLLLLLAVANDFDFLSCADYFSLQKRLSYKLDSNYASSYIFKSLITVDFADE